MCREHDIEDLTAPCLIAGSGGASAPAIRVGLLSRSAFTRVAQLSRRFCATEVRMPTTW